VARALRAQFVVMVKNSLVCRPTGTRANSQRF
jgi:hypothetical protein